MNRYKASVSADIYLSAKDEKDAMKKVDEIVKVLDRLPFEPANKLVVTRVVKTEQLPF